MHFKSSLLNFCRMIRKHSKCHFENHEKKLNKNYTKTNIALLQ